MAESGQYINVKDAGGTVRQVALYTGTGDVPANPLRCGYNGEDRYGGTVTDESSVMYKEQYSGWDIDDNGTVRHVVCRPVVRVTFTLDPAGSTLYVNGQGQTLSSGSCTVDFDYGTAVTWEASCDGYVTRTGSFTALADITVVVELEADEYLRIVDDDGNVYTDDVHAYAVGDSDAWISVWDFSLEASDRWSFSRELTSGSSNVTLYYDPGGDDEWNNLTEGKTYSGSYKMQIMFPNASATEERGGTVVFTSESGRRTATIDWLMSAKGASISVSPTSLTFAYEGEEQTARVSCDTSWKVASQPSWLDVSPDSGSSSATVTLTAQHNNTGSMSARNGTVVFQTTDGSVSCNLLVTQSMGYMTASPISWNTAANTNHNSAEQLGFELDFRSGVSKVTLESPHWYGPTDEGIYRGITQVHFEAGMPEGHYEEDITADGEVSIPDMTGNISYDCSISYRGMTGAATTTWSMYMYAWDSNGNYLSGLHFLIKFV